jgi:hypothetical protein
MKNLFFSMIFVLAACTNVMADESAVGSTLPPNVRVLLIQEMIAVLDASKTILDALVRGQDEVVAKNAQAIHDSFIMAQKMTEADKQALLKAVPEAFLKRDEAFHELSARLAEAARKGDKGLQRKLYYEAIDSCVACHANHATDRFPELRQAGR